MSRIADFFVDEAGDLTLFDRKGRVLLGTDGVSNHFMVGVAHILDVEMAHDRLESLRTRHRQTLILAAFLPCSPKVEKLRCLFMPRMTFLR